jgi:hypothetical protein
VFELGGDTKSIDTEDIAIKANMLAPGRFSWQKYPDRINLEAVRKRLSDAKKVENGGYISGSPKKGWLLTLAGLKWAKTVSKVFEVPSVTKTQPVGGSVDINRYRREKKRIQTTDAWMYWLADKRSITKQHANAVFRIDSYASSISRSQKIERLKKLMIEDKDLTEFLDSVSRLVET